jgi:hypothetical protein
MAPDLRFLQVRDIDVFITSLTRLGTAGYVWVSKPTACLPGRH